MDFIGKEVKHNKFGAGVIVRQKETNGKLNIYVCFFSDTKKEHGFQFPDAFLGKKPWLSTLNEEINVIIKNIPREKKVLIDTKESRHNSIRILKQDKVCLVSFKDRVANIVKITSDIDIIGERCFANMENIQGIYVSEGVEEIGDSAFEGCKNLKKIILPRTLKRIGPRAFAFCVSLREIIIPSGCIVIENAAFCVNRKLKRIYCGAEAKPEGWHDGWNGNFEDSTTVFWGAFDIESVNAIKNNIRKQPIKQEIMSIICDKTNILYIYKGNIRCHKNKHCIISATATVRNKNDAEVRMNVEYCKDCDKLLLNYKLFELYKEEYGALIGNFRLVENDNFNGKYVLSRESPLHLSNYNVGQKDNLKEYERHYILASIIYDGIMQKYEVVEYLRFFIECNGSKKGNELAVSKWKEDLKFVQEYDINIQPRIAVKKIEKFK